MNVFLVVTMTLIGMPSEGQGVTAADVEPVTITTASIDPMPLAECRTKGKRLMLDTSLYVHSAEFDCVPADPATDF